MHNGLNNGYIIRVHFFDGTTRYFGSYSGSNLAFDKFKIETLLKVIIPEEDLKRNHAFRPVLGKKYKVEFSRRGVTAISIVTLETDINLSNLKNPNF